MALTTVSNVIVSTAIVFSNARQLMATLPGEVGFAGFPLTHPVYTSCLTQSHHVLLIEEEGQW